MARKNPSWNELDHEGLRSYVWQKLDDYLSMPKDDIPPWILVVTRDAGLTAADAAFFRWGSASDVAEDRLIEWTYHLGPARFRDALEAQVNGASIGQLEFYAALEQSYNDYWRPADRKKHVRDWLTAFESEGRQRRHR